MGQYGFGLDGNTVPYIQSIGVAKILSQYSARNVTYVSGSCDVCDHDMASQCGDFYHCAMDDHDLDHSCEAYAQGWCRMERAHAFIQHVRKHYQAPRVHNLL